MNNMFIGLMSGTSLDGLDTALVNFDNNQAKLVATQFTPYSESFQKQLKTLCLPSNNEIESLAKIQPYFVKMCAHSINKLLTSQQLNPNQIKAIGSHGQTIRHRPEKQFTLQIDDPSLLAELTGITVIGDFRRRDIAAGGQGAPLVPAFHQYLFQKNTKNPQIIINIGGIANASILTKDSVKGFDTGPGNTLMDYWSQTNINRRFDVNGQWGDSQPYNSQLLKDFLTEPYFHLNAPKSTGVELFNASWLDHFLKKHHSLSATVIQSTLCQLTATSIFQSITKEAPKASNIYICGGGAHNHSLLKRLQQLLPEKIVASTQVLGIDPNWIEAMAFAWFAKQTLSNKTSNVPEVTGASGYRVLGGIYLK